MDKYYDWFKVLHLIFLISWMAGMFYLPRLFVYHVEVKSGSKEDKRFQIMEKNLLRIIMNVSMILTIIFGLCLAYIYGFQNLGLWFHLKMLLVVLMACLHMFFANCRKKFENNKNNYSGKFFRIMNEIPVLLMILIVIMVIIKPFD